MERLLSAINERDSWSFLRTDIEDVQRYVSIDLLKALEGSKSILEAISHKILKDRGVIIPESPNTAVLVKKAFQCLPASRFIESKDLDAVKKVAGSFASLGSTIGEFRNRYGPISHGKDPYANKIDEHLVIFTIASADLVASYLVELDGYDMSHRTRLDYSDYPKFNQKIDDEQDETVVVSGSVLNPSLCLFYADPEYYKEALYEFLEEKRALIKKLRISESFVNTRRCCNDINPLRLYLEDGEINEIAHIFISNPQVHRIIKHGHTQNLYLWILHNKSDTLEDKQNLFEELSAKALF